MTDGILRHMVTVTFYHLTRPLPIKRVVIGLPIQCTFGLKKDMFFFHL